jgi:hypothetical protein
MSNKIKVDPRTFKIIQPLSQTSSETFTSDGESDTESSISVNSDTESVKVIKLDNSEQSGGKNISNIQLKSQSELKTKSQPPFQIQSKPQQSQPQPPQSQPQPPQSQSQPQQSQPQSQSKSESIPVQSVANQNFEKNLKNYLSINNNNESEILNNGEDSKNLEVEDTEDTEDTVDTEDIEETMNSQSTKSEKTKQVESTQDVFDLTQNKLYQVLSKLFEDENGKNISENITEMSKLFEKHNQIMEKMLNQLIIMNSNYKQAKTPEVVQTTTKTAGNTIDFRKEQRQEPRQEQRQEQRQEPRQEPRQEQRQEPRQEQRQEPQKKT